MVYEFLQKFFSRFVAIHAFYGPTDGRTDGRTDDRQDRVAYNAAR